MATPTIAYPPAGLLAASRRLASLALADSDLDGDELADAIDALGEHLVFTIHAWVAGRVAP